MGKLTGIALVVVLALGIAVPAQAGRRGVPDPVRLSGKIEHGGRAHVAVSYLTRDGRLYRRYRYRFGGITVRCDGGLFKAANPISGGEMIWNKYADDHPFGVDAIEGPFNDPTYKSEIRGGLVSPTKARGWVRISGRRVSLKGGGQKKCDSGRLHWVAYD